MQRPFLAKVVFTAQLLMIEIRLYLNNSMLMFGGNDVSIKRFLTFLVL